MVNGSSFSNLYSHPNKALEEHLVNVAHIAQENLIQSPKEIFDKYGKDKLARLIKTCGLCHDIGKATSYFQTYLNAPEQKKKELKEMEETHHGLLSAVASFFEAKAEFEQDDLRGDEGVFLSFIAFLTVKKHHGNFEDVVDEATFDDKKQSVLMSQIDSMDDKKLSLLNQNLKSAGLKLDIIQENLKKWVMALPDELRKIKRKLRKLDRYEKVDPYLLANFLFSLLIDADKSEVSIGKTIERKQIEMDEAVVDKFKSTMDIKDTKINHLREKAYQEVLSREIDLSQRIFSINLPTGLGKTLTSFAFALKLRKRVEEEKGFIPRIIYSLPFLSIIEQNADQFEKVLRENGFDVDTSLLLKHHHLSDVYYKKDEDEFEPDQAKILIEGWNSEIIVTTFIQLFHTLVSYKNKNLRKFHRLAGSIIILDEVQSIPSKYWLLVRELFKNLTDELCAYIIFVTATEPLIFDKQEVCPLVNRESYFDAMDRVTVRPMLNEDISLEEFAENLDLKEDKSYLFILNTIKSAKAFYEMLEQKTNGREITYLSTHVLPYERLERINKMRDGKVGIAVTTQLVEAGVDIDFDIVYRDMAPLDCINQAAGRCNRNGNEKGEVIVISLKDEKRPYSRYIYDDVLLDITRRILEKNKVIREKDFLNIIEEYYGQVQEKKTSQTSRELLNAVYKMKYDSVDDSTSIADFKLIEGDYPKIDVFVELNEEAMELWERYLQIKCIKNLFERRIAFSKIKADFYKYTVSVPVNIQNIPPEVEGFRYVNHNSLENYYDKTTGFICEGGNNLW